MSAATAADQLSKAIAHATRSAHFCVAGCLPVVDPGLEVDGLGAIRLPLKRARAKELIARCRVAPYGKGTETLVNRKVRDTLELDPRSFRLSQHWDTAIAEATRLVAGQLGLPADQVEARLYKLLVYEKGGFFLPHRDSEKHDGMVASLIVVLPSPFEGGALVVRHGAVQQPVGFAEAAHGKAPCYAAFYADCEHEVQRVTHGLRLCLAYNLVLKPNREKSQRSGKSAGPASALTESIRSWIATRPAAPLVFALQHHYTQRGLSLDLLKGADRQLAALVAAAADKTDCLVHLAQVSRHLSQFADDGSYERSYRRHAYYDYRPPRLEIGETYEDDLHGDEWADIQGKKQPWGAIAFEPAAIVCATPLDEWKPTSEEYEGYTGNAGNTLDRWYHRSAIVLWHRDHHFDVIATCGEAVSMPLFRAMMAKLAKTPKKRLEEARSSCIRFARAIIGQWPRSHARFNDYRRGMASLHEDFPDLLLTLRDRDTIAQFLAKLADQDHTLRLTSFVPAACRALGWNAFAQELKQLIAPPPREPDPYGLAPRDEIPARDFEWLAAFCLDRTADADQLALAHALCELAVQRFCTPPSPHMAHYGPDERRAASVAETSLPLLLKALVASCNDDGLAQVIQFVERFPEEYRLDECQVPALKATVPWARKQDGVVHPLLLSWLESVRRKLEAATAHKPQPPADWARAATVDCRCQYCTQLNTFLADRVNEVGRIKAPEGARHHVTSMITRHHCDVTHALERTGSPYSLVLRKTTASFDRAARRFEADCRLLSAIAELSKGVAP